MLHAACPRLAQHAPLAAQFLPVVRPILRKETLAARKFVYLALGALLGTSGREVETPYRETYAERLPRSVTLRTEEPVGRLPNGLVRRLTQKTHRPRIRGAEVVDRLVSNLVVNTYCLRIPSIVARGGCKRCTQSHAGSPRTADHYLNQSHIIKFFHIFSPSYRRPYKRLRLQMHMRHLRDAVPDLAVGRRGIRTGGMQQLQHLAPLMRRYSSSAPHNPAIAGAAKDVPRRGGCT